MKNFDLVVIKSCRVTQGEVHFKVKVRAHMMSKSKIPVRDLTPMFHQTPAMDKESHRSRRDKISSFSANFTPDRSKSLERHQRSNEKVKDMRNLVRQNIFFVGKLLCSFSIDFPEVLFLSLTQFRLVFVPLAICVFPSFRQTTDQY